MELTPYEQKYGLPQGILKAVMATESAGNPNAVSPKGARGLFQFMPETAAELGIDPMVPEQAADGAARYLKQNYDKFGNWEHALAAYNAGPGNVQKYGGVPPFKETQNYVSKIGGMMQQTVQQPTTTMTQEASFAQMQPKGSWRDRATPVQPSATTGSWKSRATPIQAQPSLMDNIKSSWKERSKQVQQSVDAYQRGEQGLASTLYQGAAANASKATDTVGQALLATPVVGPAMEFVGEKVLAPAGRFVSNLPTFDPEAPTLGDVASQAAEEYPTLARNLRATTEIVNLGGTALGLSAGVQTVKAAGKAAAKKAMTSEPIAKFLLDESTGPRPKAPKAAVSTAADVKDLAAKDYGLADEIGAKFTPEQVSAPFAKKVNELKPKPLANGRLTTEDKVLLSHLQEYDGLDMKDLTLQDVDKLDKSLTAKINTFVDKQTGGVDATGRQLQQLQHALRKVADETDTPGNDALINGKAAWATSRRIGDLEAIAERASVSLNPRQALQSGYKSLYLDKDAIRGWPKEAVALLKKAATPGMTMELLRPLSSRLTAIIAGGSGNLVAGAGANLVGMAARGVEEAYVAGKGAKVQKSLVNNMMKNRREVVPPGPVAPLLLASPNKMGPLPMSDTQISIAQKLMKGGNTNTAEATTPAVIKPPVSQMTRLEDSLPKGSNKAGQLKNMKAQLKAGTLSQNKFVEQATKAFGLNTKQARDLAQEVKKYWQPESKSAPLEKASVITTPTGKPLYRGVDGLHPTKEFSFWTDDPDQASAYAKGAALTNSGKDPRLLSGVFDESKLKGRNIDKEILEALIEGDDPDDIAISIMKKEKLDYVDFYHPNATTGRPGASDEHLVRVIRNPGHIQNVQAKKLKKGR